MLENIKSQAANPANLQLSTEKLLELGADSRSMTGKNGLTSYGTSPGPRDAVPFGSCTASSPIECVFDAAVMQRDLLREAQEHNELLKQIRLSYHKIGMTLRHHLRIAKKDVRIALAPSGTDLEFLALALALGDRSRPLCNIVVGPQEIGSGSSMAAAGCYFDSILPHGPSRIKDTPVLSSISSLVHVETIPIRDAYGCIREQHDIDSETETIVNKAIAKRERVLIHIVAHSKTGVHAPGISKVRKLQRKYPRDISVVVDAAQARLSRQSLIAALEEGFWVLFTGSKFFGGPSFSGALLVPASYDSVVQMLPPLPVEFGSYFSRWDFPKQWDALSTKLSHDYNLGLLLRWFAALESMRAYYSVPGRTRLAIFKHFENMILKECEKYPYLKLDQVPSLQFPAGKERLLESKTTVFPLFVQTNTDSGKIRYFQNDELKKICKWINEDISRFAGRETTAIRKVLSSKFHIGQPVSIGNVKHPAVLRIALGAALVTEVGLNHSYGSVLGERLEWLEEQIRNVFFKLDWISRNYILLDENKENRR
jgi:hypothetical protein